MNVDDLRTEMKSEFERSRSEVQGEFTSVRQEFANFRAEVKDEFTSVRQESANFRTEVKDEFANVRTELKALREELKAEMKSQAETTRRHFDIMVEKVNDSVKIVAEVNAHHASRLNNHDTRLKALEKNRRA
jgi:flagellar motility protein MotE (MotC chaperone)